MVEFWERNFREKGEMWGAEPTDAAIASAELFREHGLKNVLIPGIGYGRNAKPFIDQGMRVTGIEISQTAINFAKEHHGDRIRIHHGSTSDMPFDEEHYDGVFCYALLHLLDEKERLKLINDCYGQLTSGIMVFVTISTMDSRYGKGTQLSANRFRTKHGVDLFFHDPDSIRKEFGDCGLSDAREIQEPSKGNTPQVFWQITCKK